MIHSDGRSLSKFIKCAFYLVTEYDRLATASETMTLIDEKVNPNSYRLPKISHALLNGVMFIVQDIAVLHSDTTISSNI